MSFWDPRYEEAQAVPELIVPELMEEDLKTALTNYVHRNIMHGLEKEVYVLSYQATKMSVSTSIHTYALKVNFLIANENHHVKLILKIQNSDDQERKTLHQRQTFLKELIFFGCIVPKFRDFMPWKSSELPVPDCYLAKSNNEAMLQAVKLSPCCFLFGASDILMLEDVGKAGYHVNNHLFDINQVRLGIKSLAELHAMSVLLNRRGASYNVSLVQTFPSLTEETLYNKHLSQDFYDKFSAAIQIFSVVGPRMRAETLLPGRNLEKVVRVMMRDLWDTLEDSLKPSATHLNALCLIDCDLDSFAFINDDKSQPRACKIVKFQNIKYSRPVIDIVQFLYNCTSRDLRESGIKYFIELYHDEFHSVIQKCVSKYHPGLPMPSGLLSIAELYQCYLQCEVIGAANHAITTSLACLLHYDPYTSSMNEDLYLSTREMLQNRQGPLPSHAELKKRAEHAIDVDPRYLLAMYKSLSNLLECISRAVNCEKDEPHRDCPHPQPNKNS